MSSRAIHRERVSRLEKGDWPGLRVLLGPPVTPIRNGCAFSHRFTREAMSMIIVEATRGGGWCRYAPRGPRGCGTGAGLRGVQILARPGIAAVESTGPTGLSVGATASPMFRSERCGNRLGGSEQGHLDLVSLVHTAEAGEVRSEMEDDLGARVLGHEQGDAITSGPEIPTGVPDTSDIAHRDRVRVVGPVAPQPAANVGPRLPTIPNPLPLVVTFGTAFVPAMVTDFTAGWIWSAPALHGAPGGLEAPVHSVPSGVANGLPEAGQGLVEPIRLLRMSRRSAIKSRTQALNQIKAILDTVPDELREQLISLTNVKLIATLRRLRVPGWPELAAAKTSLKLQVGRIVELNDEVAHLDGLLDDLFHSSVPTLLAIRGVGPESTLFGRGRRQSRTTPQ
jgi:hypothetical protein